MDFLGSVVNSNATTPAEKQLRPILCDEGIQVLSTFELNQVASLTYNDVTCDGIFEFIEKICKSPLDHTPLTLQKSLIVTKHIVVYGAEKTVNHAYALQGCVTQLLEFNTVLMTQKQGGAMSFFQTLQGGAVDKGGPVREAADQLLKLLGNINELRRLRIASASDESLVPVGNNDVAFVTDDVRLHVLKRRIEEERKVRIQSNLKKSEGGFGGGYASKDGRSVVGAAHGIEEMIKMANIQTNKFSDDGTQGRTKTREEIILEELKAEADAEKAAAAAANAPPVDLLGSFNPAPNTATSASAGADLLNFGGSSGGQPPVTGDLLGGGLPASTPATASSLDPFAPSSAYNATTTNQSAVPSQTPASSSLLDFSVQNDPFAPVSAMRNQSINSDGMNLLNMNTMSTNTASSNNPMMSMMQTPMQMPNSSINVTQPGAMSDLTTGLTSMSLSGSVMAPTYAAPPSKPPIMASNEDRFSALDALAAATPTLSQATAQDAKNAENRLLGFASSSGNTTAASSNLSTVMGSGSALPPMPMGMAPPPPIPEPMITPGSGQVAKAYGDPTDNDAGDNPWVMGGTTGMGLEPVGPEPTAPPPPPPPDF